MTDARRAVHPWLAALALALSCGAARADGGVVAARAASVAPTLSAFARVEPVALARLNAASAGIVAGLRAVPGDRVEAGAALGRLAGPEIGALLAQRRSALAAAQAALGAARQALAAARQDEGLRLATRETVAQAEAAAIRARVQRDAAKSRLAAARAAADLRAPATGTILTLDAADGERLVQGQTILTVQPADGLWLRAALYGRAARQVHAGMTGRFAPAGGGASIAVRVRSVFGALQPDGARAVGLVALGGQPEWINGEAGSVALEAAKKTFAEVPTRALILDRGQWWVLVRGAHGDERRTVTPGPSRGEWTLIERGVEPGTQVVVENAYLEFHRDVARRYQPPD
ncbi:MAG TPA: efflux RND transporter periplasmic adaptor subunit [Burkholderiales bacterium]|nr:efflux RND transporter periplasmic adaptor subunit [Burkholderiales bacterium]